MTRILTSTLCIVLLSCSGTGAEPRHPGEPPPPAETDETAGDQPHLEDREPVEIDQVLVELFIMSQCPYGSQVVQGFHQAQEALGAHMDFRLDFIATQNQDGSFKCLHGESECEGNMIMLCAREHAPAQFLALAACMMEDFKEIPSNWPACSSQVGLALEPVQTCIDSGEAATLFAASLARSQDRQAKGSPTIFIGGEEYRGGRSGPALTYAVCQQLEEEERPASCPTPEPVRLTIISDERCSDCEPKARKMIAQLEKMIIDLQVEWLDWAEQEARDLAAQTGVTFLPAYVFNPGVEQSFGWDFLHKWVEPSGDLWLFRPGPAKSTHDPTGEICDNDKDDDGNGKIDCKDPGCTFQKACREDCTNGVDDTGNGKKDCKDPGCKGHEACLERCDNGSDDDGNGKIDCKDPGCDEALACRKEKKGTLDLFLMSDCKYCDKAVNALLELDDSTAGAMKVKVHFVMAGLDGYGYADYENKSRCEQYPDGFWYCSLHGTGEVRENLRRMCIQALYPDELLPYIGCKSGGTDWEACTKKLGLVPPKIEKCMTGKKGQKLMQKNARFIFKIGINKSPAFLWNNKHVDHTKYTPGAITETFCTYNPDLKPCK
jgi:hypothetical protein